jgi:hypothetical protein
MELTMNSTYSQLNTIELVLAEAQSWNSSRDVRESSLNSQISTWNENYDMAMANCHSDTLRLTEAKTKLAQIVEYLKTLISSSSSKAFIAIQKAKMKDLKKEIDALEETLLTTEEHLNELHRSYSLWENEIGHKVIEVVTIAHERFKEVEYSKPLTSAASHSANSPLSTILDLLKSAVSYVNDADVSFMITSALFTYGTTAAISHIGSLGMFAQSTTQIEAPQNNIGNATRFSF